VTKQRRSGACSREVATVAAGTGTTMTTVVATAVRRRRSARGTARRQSDEEEEGEMGGGMTCGAHHIYFLANMWAHVGLTILKLLFCV
jgi:hypothetical protein